MEPDQRCEVQREARDIRLAGRISNILTKKSDRTCADSNRMRVGQEVVVNVASQFCGKGEKAAVRVIAVVCGRHDARATKVCKSQNGAADPDYLLQLNHM